jgi:hypothetical protein
MPPILAVAFCADLIRTVLRDGPFADVERAVSLILGTMAHESAFTYTQQIGGGPAKGYLQIEGPTEQSVWADYLAYNPEVAAFVTSRCGHGGPDETALQYDLVYGIVLARILYFWRDPERLPPVEDIAEQAYRYKKFYNTIHGSATEGDYIEAYAALVSPHYPARPA